MRIDLKAILNWFGQIWSWKTHFGRFQQFSVATGLTSLFKEGSRIFYHERFVIFTIFRFLRPLCHLFVTSKTLGFSNDGSNCGIMLYTNQSFIITVVYSESPLMGLQASLTMVPSEPPLYIFKQVFINNGSFRAAVIGDF